MCDFEAFYRRIAKELPNNCRIAEVGVADGYSALMLAYFLYEEGKNFHLTMIDSCDYGHGDQANEIMKNIIKSELGWYIDFMQVGSLDASCKFNDNSLDFVFIDASHKYEETKADIRLWYRKVKDEGILAGHDYSSPENPGVGMAVNEVIPATVLKVNETKPSQVLRLEATSNNLGVWWVRKDWQVNLK
jgi:predicted O-methyltransferase YrrM